MMVFYSAVKRFRLLWPGIAFLCCSCAPMIATQHIPVSSNPSGATVLVDGSPSCTTPCGVELPRNQDHILTLQKPGYRQQDVTIKRQYQTQQTLLNAINSGFNTGTFFNDPAMGMNSAVQSLNRQKETGEAYLLVPSTVTVALVPTNGFPRRSTETEAEETLQSDVAPLDYMDRSDEQMLEGALETSGTGNSTVWTNGNSGVWFAVQPEEASPVNGAVVRYFVIAAKKDGEKISGRYPAYRVGRGEWVIGELPQVADTTAPDDTYQNNVRAAEGIYRALGESASMPKMKKDWTVNKSSRTQTKQRPDGSIVTKTKKSSTKVGVSVGPGAVFGILDALDSLGSSGQNTKY